MTSIVRRAEAALARRSARAAGSSRCRLRVRAAAARTPCDRDSSAAFTSNDGFSVVAPIRTMSPASTRGRNASCCALLKRWISSTKTIVRRPRRAPRPLGLGHHLADLLDAREHRAERRRSARSVVSAMMRASVVLPVPGGPQRMIDCSRSRSIASRSGLPGRQQVLLADVLVERARPHALGERRAARPALAASVSSGTGPGAFMSACAPLSLAVRLVEHHACRDRDVERLDRLAHRDADPHVGRRPRPRRAGRRLRRRPGPAPGPRRSTS